METVLNPGIKSNFLPPPFLPYTYQVPIIKDMTKVILEGKSGLVIQPTATGKSVEAAFTARACILLHNMKGLYLYNENEGIEQARIKFAEVFAGNNILCGNFFGYGRDEFVYRADMVFASFQSLNSHHGKWYTTFDKNHFGFVIVNEAHHGQAETYKEVIQHFECGKIGMTATEKRMDGKDIEELFPHIICEIRLEKAIANQWVCPLEYLTLANGISEYRLKKICHDILKKGKRVSLRQLNETIFIESLDREILKEVYAYALPINEKSRQTLFFCENINHANHVLRLLQKDGMSAEAIHSKLPSQKNRSVMKRFRNGEIQFLLSVDKLNEDIDLPNVEVGVFLRATSSENIFLQQLGRLLRKTPQKEKAYVLDFVGNVERIVMVQQLQEKVERFYLKDKVSAPKDLIHIKGYGFKFMFDRQFKNILEVLRVIREGAYPTWKEASDVIIKAGIITSTQYLRRYKTIDLRLPADPSKVYKDFPGWDVFLNKQTSPNAWKTAFEISQKVKIGKKIIITFVKREYENNKSWVKKYWRQGQYIEHYHPSLVAIIKRKFSKKKDWLLLEEAVNLIGVGRYKVLRTAKLLQVQYPNEMAEFFTQGLDYPSWQPYLC
jgi:superfamily II DNA or RNA helicase